MKLWLISETTRHIQSLTQAILSILHLSVCICNIFGKSASQSGKYDVLQFDDCAYEQIHYVPTKECNTLT